MIMKFDDICKWLVDNDFRRVSVEGPNKWVYMNDDYSLSVVVKEHYEDKLTLEDEERIRARLVELGYL